MVYPVGAAYRAGTTPSTLPHIAVPSYTFSRVAPLSDMLHINDGLAVQTQLLRSEFLSGVTTEFRRIALNMIQIQYIKWLEFN
jgi:uncharacterized ion transporter superfamily protein YfcC